MLFKTKPNKLPLRPDDIVMITGDAYGGTYKVLIDYMRINKDISIDFKCIKFSEDLDDWEDLAFNAISVASDDTVGAMAAIVSSIEGVEMPKTGLGTLKFWTYQNDSFADDGMARLPDATDGMVFVPCNGESGHWNVEADGTVTKVSGTTNTAAADSDGNLCIYESGSQAIVKNRLGVVGKIRIWYSYN